MGGCLSRYFMEMMSRLGMLEDEVGVQRSSETFEGANFELACKSDDDASRKSCAQSHKRFYTFSTSSTLLWD